MNFAVSPSATVVVFGWLVIAGLEMLVTVRVAALEVTLPAAFVTLQRYW